MQRRLAGLVRLDRASLRREVEEPDFLLALDVQFAELRAQRGDIVTIVGTSGNRAGGAYEITQLLPLEAAEPSYRIKSVNEPHERVVREHEIQRSFNPWGVGAVPLWNECYGRLFQP